MPGGLSKIFFGVDAYAAPLSLADEMLPGLSSLSIFLAVLGVLVVVGVASAEVEVGAGVAPQRPKIQPPTFVPIGVDGDVACL
jgi:hypothetical protein